MKQIKKITILIFTLVFTVFMSCEKDTLSDRSNDLNNQITIENILTITINSDSLERYEYGDLQMVYSKDYSQNDTQETTFEYDSIGNLISMSIKMKDKLIQNEFSYNSDSLITSIKVSQKKNGVKSIIETQQLDYDFENRLIKINAFLPETFEYSDSNVVRHGMVNDLPVWVEYTYTYDSKLNPLSKIGLPPISNKQISQNNITSVTASWTEYVDCMIFGDTSCSNINHTDLVYTSTFEYNDQNLPLIEYRDYGDKVDTLRYYYE